MLTNPINNKKIRFHIIWSLVFSFLFFNCSENKKKDSAVTIQWEGRRAESITIPRDLLAGIPKDSIKSLLHIQLANTNASMLGEYIINDDAVIFRPLIAFTHGLKYEVRLSHKLLSEFEIPSEDIHESPEVISIYPSADSLPLNLLKIYIAFSKPMQEGQSAKNISVIKNKDTVPSVFLDLEPELWNKERTMLTLWLDPGRIKRDLQPNKRLGSPLQHGAHYQIVINRDWQGAEGGTLTSTYHKNFTVGMRDSLSPDPGLWTIYAPKAGSKEPLKISLHEPLDYILLKNAFRIADSKDNTVNGFIETEAEETILNFTPSLEWNPGDYIVEIESKLEDLAGNNLNRLFDKDLTKQGTSIQKEIYKRLFHVH